MKAIVQGWGVFGVAVGLSAMRPSIALASPSDPAMARQLLKEGYDLAQSGKCPSALRVFQRSIDLDPQPKTYLNLARCDEDVGRYGDALKHWVLARDLARDQQLRSVMSEAETRLASLEERMPYVTLRVGTTPANELVLRRDGTKLPVEAIGRPLPLDPGKHLIVVESQGHLDRTISLNLVERDHLNIVVEPGELLPKPAPAAVASTPKPLEVVRGPIAPATSSTSTVLLWSGLGITAVGVVAGTITGVMTLSKSGLADQCPNQQCPEDVQAEVERARVTGTISTVAFATAGVGLAAAGLGLYLRTHTSKRGETTLTPTASGAVMRWTF